MGPGKHGRWRGVLIPPFAVGRSSSEELWDHAFPNAPRRWWEDDDNDTLDDGYADRIKGALERRERTD